MRKKTILFAVAVVVGMSTLIWAQADSSSAVQPVPKTGSLKPSNKTKFAFIVAGDNRPAKAGDSQPKTAKHVFDAAKKEKADFAVWTGDTIYGLDSADPKAIAKQYKDFFDLAAKAGVPVFNAPGNHEMDVKVKDNPNLKEEGSAAMEALYRTNMGIADGGQIYGSFSYGNAHFILLNTEEIPPSGATRSPGAIVGDANSKTKVNLDPGYISDAQMQWLTDDLNANKAATHIFIFMHHPIKPKKSDMGLNQTNADALITLFKNYSNIDYVFASHEHLYYNPQTGDDSQPPNRTDPSKDPPYYLISGGAGAPLAKGGAYNYLVVSVDGSKIKVKMVPVQ